MAVKQTLRTLIPAIFLVVSSAVFGLDPSRSFFQYNGGAANPEVRLPNALFDVKQDSQGLLWLASHRGLIKFDGLETTTYRVSQYPALQSNQIGQLFINSRDQLFIASRGGLSLFDGNEFSVIVTGHSWAREIHAITEHSDGSMWFGSTEGLWRLELKDSIPDAVTHVDFGYVGSLLSHNDRLYVGTIGQLHIIDDGDVSTVELPTPLSPALVRDLVPHQGRIWGATHAGLFNLHKTQVEIPTDEKLVGFGFDALLADKHDNLWFAGEKAMGRFFPNGDLELPNFSDIVGFEPEINSIIEDSMGRQWDTSSFHGLSLSYSSPSTTRVSFSEGLPSTTVTALARDHRGTIYLATDLGVSTLRGSTLHDIIHRDFADEQQVRAMVFLDKDTLWLGTGDGLLVYRYQGNSWELDTNAPTLDRRINAIAQDAENLWLGTDSGLYRAKDGDLNVVFETTESSIESLFIDSTGQLWIGTQDSLDSLANGKLTHHQVEVATPLGAIVAIVELPTGSIVAATADNGILLQKNDSWVLLGEANGMPPEQLISMEYSHDALWVATGAGVFQLTLDQLSEDPSASPGASPGPAQGPSKGTAPAATIDRTLSFEPVFAYDKYRPIEPVRCCSGNNQASTMLADQQLVVTTDDGIVMLDLTLSNPLNLTPKPYIKSVTASTTAIVDYANTFTLDPNQLPLRIEYSAVQLNKGNLVRFRYRLSEQDDWVNLGKSRVAELRDLAPGDYRFELQASSQTGMWFGDSASFSFQREATFAESRTFKALLWAAALLAGFILVWLRTAALRYHHRQLEQRIDQRTEALNSVNVELKSVNSELRRANQTDPLTGLINRRFFDASADHASSEELAESGVLIMIDIDYFKDINDSYGHAVGDDVLCQFAEVLRSITRRNDLVTRWGGEEFMLVCQCPNDDAASMLQRVSTAVDSHRFKVPEGDRIKVSCSTGGVRYPLRENESIDTALPTLFELADAALYAVKLNGRSGWALLETTNLPLPNLSPRRMARSLAKLVKDGFLNFSANRPEIQPPTNMKVSRLSARHSPVK